MHGACAPLTPVAPSLRVLCATVGFHDCVPLGDSLLPLSGAAVYRRDDRQYFRYRLYSSLKNWRFVSEYRFSDTVSPSRSDAPLGAGHRISSFSENCEAERTFKINSNWPLAKFICI